MGAEANVIGHNVFFVRKIVLQLTQEQFAELLDISKDTVSNIERGKVTPSTETLTKLSVKTGISIDFLLNERADANELHLYNEYKLRSC